jgi:hypothetical protein
MVEISSRRLRRHAKILIFRIGDWETEQPTLNPLAASLKSQLSLLLPPNEVDVEYIRTLDEMAEALRVHGGGGNPITARQNSPWGYAVFVGHGRAGPSPAMRFGSTWHGPSQVAEAIKGPRRFADIIRSQPGTLQPVSAVEPSPPAVRSTPDHLGRVRA